MPVISNDHMCLDGGVKIIAFDLAMCVFTVVYASTMMYCTLSCK